MVGRKLAIVLMALAATTVFQGCSGVADAPLTAARTEELASDYLIGPGDQIQVFVWRNPELTTSVRVRPDGKISVPLIEDLPIAGMTPTKAGRAIEEKLSNYVKDAIVTVIMVDFVGPVERQIRVVGEASKPAAIPYRQGMTVMDVMIQAGGLTQFAAGNRALVMRTVDGKAESYKVRLDDLMKDGDLSANVQLAPGDVLMIPQTWF